MTNILIRKHLFNVSVNFHVLQYGIKANTLSNWVKKYREENETAEVSFVELKSTVVTQRQLIKISKNGIQIEIPENSMPALLKEVISTLASL